MRIALQRIYKKRFSGLAERNVVWSALVEHVFQKYIFTSDIVLDVGCGYGEFINSISCKKKYAIDILDVKKFLHKDIIFHKSSTIDIPLRSKTIDKIFVSNVFEHLSRNDIEKSIIEFKRVLKKSGEVFVVQPNVRFCGKDYWMFFDHITPIDDRALDEIFLSLGHFRSLP